MLNNLTTKIIKLNMLYFTQSKIESEDFCDNECV